jgi:hypothetical protein
MSYRSVSDVPSHSQAAARRAGNSRENFQMAGMAGGDVQGNSCSFAAPPRPRVYCMPAPFTSVDGRPYHNLVNAYGMSRPSPY